MEFGGSGEDGGAKGGLGWCLFLLYLVGKLEGGEDGERLKKAMGLLEKERERREWDGRVVYRLARFLFF